MPTKILILLFSILSIIDFDSFFLKLSLEKISIFFLGNFIFNSSAILSTPGPQKIKSQLSLLIHFRFRADLKPQ